MEKEWEICYNEIKHSGADCPILVSVLFWCAKNVGTLELSAGFSLSLRYGLPLSIKIMEVDHNAEEVCLPFHRR